MIPNADQRAFLSRLDISNEALALALQTCGIREYIESCVEIHGSTNVYGRKPDGKVERYGEAFARLWPQKKRNARK